MARKHQSITWDVVTAKHVREACRRFDAGLVTCSHPARNTFLILDGKRYPAKFIRGLAYEIATGRKLDPNVEFSGGAETARFFQRLWFQIDYRPRGTCHQQKIQGSNSSHDVARASKKGSKAKLDEKQQKETLEKVLEQAFGPVELNRSFD